MRLDLDLAADVLSRDLVHVGTDLWDRVQSVASYPEPLTLNSNRDPITAFRIRKQYAYKQHELRPLLIYLLV